MFQAMLSTIDWTDESYHSLPQSSLQHLPPDSDIRRWNALLLGVQNRSSDSGRHDDRFETYRNLGFFPFRLKDPVTGHLLRIPVLCTDTLVYDTKTLDALERPTNGNFFISQRDGRRHMRLDYDWLAYKVLLRDPEFKADFLLLTEGQTQSEIDPCDDSIYSSISWNQARLRHENVESPDQERALKGLEECQEPVPTEDGDTSS